VDSPGQGRVLVVDGGGSLRRALVGGNLGAAAARNGWAGVVVDGCVRDVAELAQSQVGIRALASMPLPTERNAAKASAMWRCRFRACGCARATGCMPTRTASWCRQVPGTAEAAQTELGAERQMGVRLWAQPRCGVSKCAWARVSGVQALSPL
jgi:hypothetical protein